MQAKRKGKRRSAKSGGGRLFLCAGTVVIVCVMLLFANALYNSPSADKSPIASPISSIEQPAAGQSQFPAGQSQPAQGNSQPAQGQSSVSYPDASRSLPANQSGLGGQQPLLITPVERRPSFDIPQAQDGARLCFVIDDGGQNLETLRSYLEVPVPIAIAVMPKLAHTKESARMVVAAGKELMLHQPMQSVSLSLWPGPGAVEPDMTAGQIKELVASNLEELGVGVRGMNNHEGSLITADLAMIGAVLDVALDYGVFFMDSRTSSNTKAPQAALSRGMKILERDIFIDNVLERDAMLGQIMEGLELANKNGKAIMIGHVDKSADILPALLTELAAELEEKGYLVVCPSQLVGKN